MFELICAEQIFILFLLNLWRIIPHKSFRSFCELFWIFFCLFRFFFYFYVSLASIHILLLCVEKKGKIFLARTTHLFTGVLLFRSYTTAVVQSFRVDFSFAV